MHRKGTETLRNAKCQTLLEVGIKTKLNARLAIWQRADLFEASNSANKISLPLRCIFFWHFFDDQIISCFTHHLYPDKTADISRRHHWFPRGKRSHRRSQKTRHHLDLDLENFL